MKAVVAGATLPAALVTLALGVLAAMELAGARPLSPLEPRSLPEAIVLGDAARAVRLLDQATPPGEVGLIRRRLLFEQPALVTGFEAAVLARDVRMLQLLQSDAEFGPARSSLACLAQDINAADVASYLTASGGAVTCEPGRMLADLLARP